MKPLELTEDGCATPRARACGLAVALCVSVVLWIGLIAIVVEIVRHPRAATSTWESRHERPR